MFSPEFESRPWAEQLAVDDASYRAQLAYLFERSDFYRSNLGPRVSIALTRRVADGDRRVAADREARDRGRGPTRSASDCVSCSSSRRVELVPIGKLERSVYKSNLVER